MSAASLEVDVAERDVRLHLDVADGETVALVGPNGAGKSTVLQVVAGLVDGAGGVSVGGREVHGLPPHRRGVGLLAQEALLFPHLSVLDNVAFGPRSRGARRSHAREVATTWLQRVGVDDLAARRPRTLSGGQAQRVAVARALATDPELLLLDEPMSALDVAARPALRRVLADVLRDRAAVIVSHDVVDALTLADRVVVVEAGRVVEAGSAREMLSRPSSVFGARLAGLDRVVGRWDGSAVVADDLTIPASRSGDLRVGEQVIALFRPSSVSVAARDKPGRLAAEVDDVEQLGDRLRVHARVGGSALAVDVSVADAVGRDLARGAALLVTVDPAEVLVRPLPSGSR